MNPSSGLKSRLMGLLAAMYATEMASPFKAMPTVSYAPTPRYSTSRKHNPAGTKLARKAAKKQLTGNIMGHYSRGLLNQFAARPRTHSLV